MYLSMKKVLLFLLLTNAMLPNGISEASAQKTTDKVKERMFSLAKSIKYNDEHSVPENFEFKTGKEITISEFETWLKFNLELDTNISLQLLNTSKDKLGFVHYRYQQFYESHPLEFAIIIAHTKNEKIRSFNGKIYRNISASVSNTINEKDALQKALNHVNAEVYKWELPLEEKQLKSIQNNPDATYYPKGELVYALPSKDKTKNLKQHKLTYKFDIYANKPLKRAYIYVDAETGEIIYENNRIHHANATGTAETMYSGTQTIITDSIAPNQFRLRDYSRGGGIITLNNNFSYDDPNATDFTDTDNHWDDISNQNNAAYDAHWATEGTFDFYLNNFGRNSIDDNGLPLTSYIHTDTLFENAYWDGATMHYGDGNPSGQVHSPLVCSEIVGHELTHGVTEFSANLIYNYESGALNESFSDIFGTAVEHYLKPNTANYTIGEDVGAIRSMENPGLFNHPDTYKGTHWDIFEEVHTNSGVQNYWFYLLAEGGSGVNDNGDSYSVTGIGIDKAAEIAYRNLTVYLTPSSEYIDARTFAIQSAQDLYGNCSNEALQTANAWHAVGIGGTMDSTTVSNFFTGDSIKCLIPATVYFHNVSSLSDSVLWDFGDGTTSTSTNPAHSYLNYGNYSVKLIIYGSCSGLADTLVKNNYITVDSSLICPTLIPVSDSGIATGPVQTKCMGILLDNGGYKNYTFGDGVLTIAPTGAANVVLNFSSFSFSNSFIYADGIFIYDGADTTSPLIGFYTGYNLPNGGTIFSSGPSVTIKQVTIFPGGFYPSGFELEWNCYMAGSPPIAYFSAPPDTFFCSLEPILFLGQAAGATSWSWDFGDGNTSALQAPSHTYSSSGSYTVTLIATNQYGSDTLTRLNCIVIDTSSNCHYTMPIVGSHTYTQCQGKLLDSGGDSDYQDNIYSEISIAPAGAATITLTFSAFYFTDSLSQMEGIAVFDGPTVASQLIGFYTGTTFPNGGTIISSGPAITIQQYSNDSITASGFELEWICNDTISTDISSTKDVTTFSVYPVPAKDYIQINLSSKEINDAEVELFDMLGNSLVMRKPGFSENGLDYKLDISNIAAGIYMLKVKTNKSDYVKKIIKM